MINIPVRVRDALKSGMFQKNYRVLVLDSDENVVATLDNDRLIKESVKLDERMCSGSTITFGLCEGSSLEFQYFAYDNINGKRIKLMLDVEYLDENNELSWYEMPMGYFTVEQCPMQFATGVYKVTAYNKLKSEYLDKDATEVINDIVTTGDVVSGTQINVQGILDQVLDGYGVIVEPDETIAIDWDELGLELGNEWFVLNYGPQQGQYIHVWTLQAQLLGELDATEYYKGYMKGVIKQVTDLALLDVSDDFQFRFIDNYWGTGYYYYTKYDIADIDARYACEMGSSAGFSVMPRLSFGGSHNMYTDSDTEYGYYTNQSSVYISIPIYVTFDQTISTPPHLAEQMSLLVDFLRIDKRNLTEIEKMKISNDDLESAGKITLRELQSAVFEMSCKFGKLDRNTDMFSGIELNNSRLLPENTLYPDDELYPMSQAERTDASAYEKLWTDSAGVQKFRKLFIYYKGLDEEEKATDFVYEITVNEDGTQDYTMDSNWLFKNLVWTEEQIAQYAYGMVQRMRNVSWFPFEMWSPGMPYLEPGDEVEISNSEGTYTSYILQRQLKGIQGLNDTFINGELDIF